MTDMTDDVLWAMKLDEKDGPTYGLPISACQIVTSDASAASMSGYLRTACGREVSRRAMNRAWWIQPAGRLPLQERHIHCRIGGES